MKYDFDSVVNRRNTNSIKWDFAEETFSVKGILPMWVADMDFRAPEPVIAAVRKAAEHGIFGYSGMRESYYEAVIGWMRKRHNWHIQREWIVFSPGVVAALHVLVKAFTEPGDQVVVQTPVYYPFFNAIRSNGCELLDNPLRLEENQYVMDLADLEAKINARTKMIILCSPHNPISRVWRQEELRELGELCLENNIIIVSDEVHEDIVYKGFKHVPFPLVAEGFADRTIVCTGASKTFNLPGLQTSNIIIPDPKLRECFCETIKRCGIHFPNLFGIAATEAAYRHGEEWIEQLLEYLQGNIAFLTGYIKDRMPGLRVIQPQGTYLLWLDFRGCGVDPARLSYFVCHDAKVGLQPGTLFGAREAGFERMNIACPRPTLAEGLARIEEALRRLKGG